MTMIGVDGCKAGWIAAIDSGAKIEIDIYPNINELVQSHPDAERLYIDIPIGLSDSQIRESDQQARQLLKPHRHTSIFSTPVRRAVYAETYPQACEYNKHATGKKISKQAWNICNKIREIDVYLQANPQDQARVFESHPELCFSRLNNSKPLEHNKKSSEGFKQRMLLLSRKLESAEQVYYAARNRFLKKQCADDDILDAMVLMIAARAKPVSHTSGHTTGKELFDDTGLRMNIYY